MKKEDCIQVLKLMRNQKWEEYHKLEAEGNPQAAHDKAVEAEAIADAMRILMDDAYAHSARNALMKRG